MTDFFKKHTLITDMLLLTMTGFLTQFLGFFYRIFLSGTIGMEGLSIYNMVHPIFGICFALYAGSIQTAASRFVAANIERGKAVSRTGLAISLMIPVALSFLICQFSLPIVKYILLEERYAPLLPLMVISVPFSAIHTCINGYYYGIQKTKVSAFSQVIGQVIRMGAVFSATDIYLEAGRAITVQLTVTRHLIGEIAARFYTMLAFGLSSKQGHEGRTSFSKDFSLTAAPLMTLALPLMGNRLVLNILTSAEAIWIPSSLNAFGLTSSEAFSTYGVLTGMTLPFILLPSTVTNSMSVLLLPTVAEAQAVGNEKRITGTISMSLRYSLYMGILCIGLFTLFGGNLGTSVFHDPNAGSLIQTLAWLYPFLYLATTMGSILNRLGRTTTTFLQSVTALLLRLAFVLFGIPRFSIRAYLAGMLASELLLACLHLYSLKKQVSFSWDALNMIIKPACLLLMSIGIYYAVGIFMPGNAGSGSFLMIAVDILLISFCYDGLLLLFHRKR